ncbi:DUF983 domain-containing protein [Paracoccus sp. (in: a-proteobacteria)]|uniref:DUF983 domain-containing protein n=1 Tax=Paracoccus sp. TaxID=267 RepID=UPI0026DEC69C|nr:DUF983 domain-containing protein [Paracoccus sp. (in: a-proteobacteria)]MDO5646601.1 DUF983 domain-containing protein [Paracoccus sp. (in: a-proteobacteria)]
MQDERKQSEALWRGFMMRCPKCGEGKIFNGYLTVVQECDHCGEPLAKYPAADGPAFFTITIVMLLLIPMIGFSWVLFRWDPITLLLVNGIASTVITLVLLRYIKGMFVGWLWAKNERDRGA